MMIISVIDRNVSVFLLPWLAFEIFLLPSTQSLAECNPRLTATVQHIYDPYLKREGSTSTIDGPNLWTEASSSLATIVAGYVERRGTHCSSEWDIIPAASRWSITNFNLQVKSARSATCTIAALFNNFEKRTEVDFRFIKYRRVWGLDEVIAKDSDGEFSLRKMLTRSDSYGICVRP
jgi:hypothetical protein